MNDKYNYSTKQYLERRCRSFNKQSFNFLSNQAIVDSSKAEFLTSCQVSNIANGQGSASRNCSDCEKFIIITNAFNQLMNGRYNPIEGTSPPAYKQVNGNYFIGLYSGYINNTPPNPPPGAPALSSPTLFWGINAFQPPDPTTTAEYYLRGGPYGTLLGKNNFNLKHDDTQTLTVCETLMSAPNTQVPCKTITFNYNEHCTCEKSLIILNAFNQSLNGQYNLMTGTSSGVYKQVNGNYFIGLYSGYINNMPPNPPSGAPALSSPTLFWGINAFAPPNPTTIAEYYFTDPTYGTLVSEDNFTLKYDDTFILSICETLVSSPTPNTQVQCKKLILKSNVGCCLLNCNNIIGIDCSLNTMKCTQTSNDCAKKGYTLCEAQNNNCKAVYKRSNPKFSTQGAVSGGSRINRLKYQTQLKAQSVHRPTKFFPGGKPGTVEARPYTTAANNNMTYRGTPYEKVNTTRGVNATNGTYPVSLYRNTYPRYKGNLSGLCLGNMGLTLNNRPQRCVMPPGQPACRALQTLPEKCHFRCAPNVHYNCTVGKKR